MSTKTVRQYSAFVGAKPQQDITGHPWSHLQAMRPTVPAPRVLGREAIEQGLAHWKHEASVALGHIADLERMKLELDE